MKSCGLKNERVRKQRDAPPVGCGPFAAVSGGASRWAAPMKYSGGRRGRAAAPPSAGAGGGGGPVPAGGRRRGAERRPQPQPQRALGEPPSLETSPGGAGRQGHGSTAERRGWGQGRGGRGAAVSLVGLLAVGIPSRGEDGDFDGGICHSAGVCPCLKGWRRKSLTPVVFIRFMCCN